MCCQHQRCEAPVVAYCIRCRTVVHQEVIHVWLAVVDTHVEGCIAIGITVGVDLQQFTARHSQEAQLFVDSKLWSSTGRGEHICAGLFCHRQRSQCRLGAIVLCHNMRVKTFAESGYIQWPPHHITCIVLQPRGHKTSQQVAVHVTEGREYICMHIAALCHICLPTHDKPHPLQKTRRSTSCTATP